MKISTTTTPSRTTKPETTPPVKTAAPAPRTGSYPSHVSSFEPARPAVSSPQVSARPAVSSPQVDSFATRDGRQLVYVSQVQGMPWLEVVRTAHGYAWKRTHIPQGMHLGAYKPGNEMRNASAAAQFTQGGWAQTTPPFTQQNIAGCGPAVVAMLASSARQVRSATGTALMDQAGQVSMDGKAGSSPQEMARMLGGQGIEVTSGVGRTDKALLSKLDASLQTGNKIVALVDSNRIDSSGSTQPGTAHWVIVDGKDTKTNEYLVKNPATGKDYFVSAQQLQQSIAGATNQGGGFLAVSAKAASAHLLQHNSQLAQVMGNTPGTGSKNYGSAHEASTGST